MISFIEKRFRTHRLVGLSYLIQWFSLFYICVTNNTYQHTPLEWTLPLTGFIQAIIASRTFTFLPRNNDVQGYYSDKRTITYPFLIENIYFSGLLLFQSLYCFTDFEIHPYVTLICVFFPYTCIRIWFPKTSLGDSRGNDRQYSDHNRSFLKAMSFISKVFYVWAKHFNGYYLNYLVFLGYVKGDDNILFYARWLLLFGGWATTIAMFLNTLKYKKIIGPKLALLLYTGTFPVIVYCLTMIQYIKPIPWLSALVMGGVICNFGRTWQHLYQLFAFFCIVTN